ncbi:GntR family transcriptional regulator [Gluconacetobacter takamatsuzukensis]|uniref:GntR family transcriptional regulator n=1 Tax=Gluconacetobacter takamatsuzukensis TaxID=1286190 RepID=A0A7W4KEL7_9PROT|nr:GntR family transcriptional regulator [Gluconacetobacter takamatsuzukensis]MBB2205528.1 GntR family transcriptional regulator [Gluconacetobacter takamatsuzukensis]
MKFESAEATVLDVRSIADQLYGLLRERILSGELEADSPIRQDVVASALNISKIPLREALARLEQDGLIRSFPKRGFFVAPLSAEEAEDVYRLRLKLEPDAASAACMVADAREQAAARAALAALEDALKVEDPAHGQYNRGFHLALVRPGAARITVHIIETLNVIADRYVRIHLRPEGRDQRANREHQAILDAWLARDRRTVGTLLKAHIRDTQRDLQGQLK